MHGSETMALSRENPRKYNTEDIMMCRTREVKNIKGVPENKLRSDMGIVNIWEVIRMRRLR